MADNHTIYRNGAKEIAHDHGHALTFMPKFDEREGNSCHIHISLWDGERSLFPDDSGHGRSPLFSSFIAGLLTHLRELTYFLAPHGQQLQALPARLVRADGARLGRRQSHVRAAGRRPRQRAAGRVSRRRR